MKAKDRWKPQSQHFASAEKLESQALTEFAEG